MSFAGKLVQALLLVCLAWGCWLMIDLSLPYRDQRPGVDFLLTKQQVYHLSSWRFSFYTHVYTSILILAAGFTQFSPRVLHRYPRLHRGIGWVYLVTVLLISGPAAFVMSLKANGGFPTRTSFVLLSLVWYACTLMALVRARQHRYQHHARWMVRSYALTLSALTLRLYAYLFDVWHIDVPPRDVYITIAWLSWVPNLLIAEIIAARYAAVESEPAGR